MPLKRAFNIAAAASGLFVMAPVIGICMILIRLTSKGPAIFQQVRIGCDERPFICYKLRTMRVGLGDVPSHEMASSAITPVGKHLRHLKLDELPQLLNIIKGEMNLVGPRPCLPTQIELIAARRRYGLSRIAPGITGVSQVAGIDMSDPDALAVSDARYLENMSLRRDLSLIWKTLAGAGRGDRVPVPAKK